MVAKISIKINNYLNNKYFEPGVAGVRCRVHRLERGQALERCYKSLVRNPAKPLTRNVCGLR